MKALSVRQPWAWLIVNGYKNVENRTWPTHIRGPVLIHAAKSMTKGEYAAALMFMETRRLPVALPAMRDLHLGGIVGVVKLAGCVRRMESPWFNGPFGFVVESGSARELPFRPCLGRLGFFDVEIPEEYIVGVRL
ncbi:MAG: ASCH domain-containing protein [Kiritimatiellae bacterium]|nr:ASCH domain-containing protein [Kiritimatiellia bacterium]